jgi:uncharacterized membrane protein YhaH (DUF805 family)
VVEVDKRKLRQRPASPLFSFTLVSRPTQHHAMSMSLLSQLTSGYNIGVGTLLLAVVLLAVAVLAVPVSAYCITDKRLGDEYNRAKWLYESILPIVKKDDAAQDPKGHHESEGASTELALSIYL